MSAESLKSDPNDKIDIRADYAESFVADRLKEIIQVPAILEQLVKDLNGEIHDQIKPIEQELAVIGVEKNDINDKLKKWQEALEDSPELIDSLKDRLAQLTLKRKTLQSRENEILSVLKHKNDNVSSKDMEVILAGLDRLLADSEKSKIKEIYRIFKNKVTFDPLNKANIKIYMMFDEAIINQLNERYKEAVSEKDTASLVISRPFEVAI